MDDPSPQAGAKRPRIFFGWYMVASSFVINAIMSAGYFQGFQAFFLPILREFGWTRTQISGAFSLRQMEAGILAPVTGFVVDKFGPRKLIMLGSVIVGLSMMGLSFIQSLWMFYLFYLMVSIGTTGVTHVITWPVLIARWFRRRRGLAMGIATSGPIVGGSLVVVNVLMVNAYGWRSVIFGYGVVMLIVGVALGFLAREHPEDMGYLPDGQLMTDAAATAASRPQRGVRAIEAGFTVVQALRTKGFWVVTIFMGASFMGNSGMQTHQVPYFENLGLSTTAAAFTVVVSVATSGIGRMGAGAMVDAMDYRVVLALFTAMMTGAFAYLLFVPIDSFVMTLPFGILFGISFGSMIPLRPVITSLMFGNRAAGSIIGLTQGGAIVAGVAGPLVMGYVFDSTGSYYGSVWVLGIVTFLTMPLVLVMDSPAKLVRRLSEKQPSPEGPA